MHHRQHPTAESGEAHSWSLDRSVGDQSLDDLHTLSIFRLGRQNDLPTKLRQVPTP